VGQGFLHPVPALTVASPTPASAAKVEPGPAAGSASSQTPAPVLVERNAPSPGIASRPASSVVASAPAGRDSVVNGRAPSPRYTDEIINDQFYLERGGQGQDPSIVPVNETQDDGVYIVF